LKITYFGNFYPRVDNLSGHSTGIAILFSQVEGVDAINVVTRLETSLPHSTRALQAGIKKIRLHPTWREGDPLSVVRAASKLYSFRRGTDLYFFNVYLTFMGNSSILNGIRLLLPFLTRTVTRKRTIVYLHNCVESQAFARLGYKKGILCVTLARLVEKFLIRFTEVIVPLDFQVKSLNSSGVRVQLFGLSG
jgi:hypothetical protein